MSRQCGYNSGHNPAHHRRCPEDSCRIMRNCPSYGGTCRPKCQPRYRYRHHYSYPAAPLTCRHIRTQKLTALNRSSVIGEPNRKFKKIYAKELFLDRNTLHFGPNIALSTTRNGNFFCKVNGETKMFQFQSPDQEPIVGPKGDKGDKGDSVIQLDESTGKLTVPGLRDIPCHQLSALFYDKQSGEILTDRDIISYSDLVDLVNALRTEVENLKEQQTQSN